MTIGGPITEHRITAETFVDAISAPGYSGRFSVDMKQGDKRIAVVVMPEDVIFHKSVSLGCPLLFTNDSAIRISVPDFKEPFELELVSKQ